jgi:hypothetical protein
MMSYLTKLRRPLSAALILTAFLTVSPLHLSAGAATLSREDARSTTTLRRTVCQYDWQRSAYQLRRLIRCAARRWNVPGGPDKAVAVARCESRFDPEAYNSGGYAGVYQQATKYWPTRARVYGFRDYSVYNGRANVIVSVRMAHRGGWDPWACA